MEIVINTLPYSFSREFDFPITVAAERRDGIYFVIGREFLDQRFKFKQVLDKRFREYAWVVHPDFVIKEIYEKSEVTKL